MLKIKITNYWKYTHGEEISKWLELPATEEDLLETLEEIGVNYGEEWFISDYETDIPGLKVVANLEALNELARRYENLD